VLVKVSGGHYKGRDTRCDKSLRHIAATSPLVCTDSATGRCDKTLIRCTQSVLKERFNVNYFKFNMVGN